MKFRKVILSMLVVFIVVVGVGMVGAQDDTQDGRSGRFGAVRQVINIVTESTDLESADILAQLREGSTLAEVITARGADVDTLIGDVVATLEDTINQAVADGKITQEHADRLLANLETNVTRIINQFHPSCVQGWFQHGVIGLAAEQTGLQPRAILRELRSGKSLADILAENDVDLNAFIDAAVLQASERAAQAVENGRITQEQADTLIERFRERLTERLNGTDEVALLAATA